VKRALLMVLVACGGASTPAGSSADEHWLEGRFHSAQLESYWQTVGGVVWGVAFDDQAHFEVNYIDGTPRVLTSLDNGGQRLLEYDEQTADAEHMVFSSPIGTVRVTRRANGWRGDFIEPHKPPVTFEVERADLPRVPAIEDADIAFAADTAKDGADGWVRHFDVHGGMRRRDHVITGADAIKEAMTKTLAAGSLTWRPVTSGARGDLGFTLGTAEFTEPGGKPEHLTYCTIWKHEADGSWKVLFDIGRPAT
jgi:ketosteroid isomerase-like protein